MELTKIKVLYVDDEPNNLISFKANYREFFEIYTAESAEAGRKILMEKEVHILITDQRMPGKSGVQFLESTLKDQPQIIRMILTGYADLETAVEAINKGQIYKYILKPFDFDDLKTTIETAYDQYVFRKSGDEALLKFRQLFEKQNEAVFIMDSAYHIQEFNNFGLNLFKIRRNELNRIYLADFFSKQDEWESVNKLLGNKQSIIDIPVQLMDSKKTIIEALLSVVPINENGILIGYQGMLRDITKQKEMERLIIRAIIETQENERMRLTRNLHDSMGQKLAAVRMFFQTLSGSVANLAKNEAFIKSNDTINEIILELRNVCFNIMPKTLSELGLEAAINELIRQNSLKGVVEFEIHFKGVFPQQDGNFEIALFRIVQEFIANSIKHGKAKKIDLKFNCHNNKIEINLKDNGCGFDSSKRINAGMGLKNIRSRVQSYHGEIDMVAKEGSGVEFSIKIPFLKPVAGS
jgi:PAS domain S-box-containing protein